MDEKDIFSGDRIVEEGTRILIDSFLSEISVVMTKYATSIANESPEPEKAFVMLMVRNLVSTMCNIAYTSAYFRCVDETFMDEIMDLIVEASNEGRLRFNMDVMDKEVQPTPLAFNKVH